ncbi:MAG: helix-turn-helix domain-containing protein [Deltaproteobacteria bacterium]|nr:helix-turn-helix domain-containing protein [Deltaproteobacteria bacterium]
MEERTVMDTGEKPGQGLDGANKTSITDNSNMSPAPSEARATNKPPTFRRELLNKLLDRKVMYEDIRTYRLSDLDIEYLFLCDSVSKREYLKLMKVVGFSRRTAYRKWWKGSFRNFDYKPFEDIRSKMIWIGADAEAKRVKEWLDTKRAVSIPAREIFRSIKDYVVELLGRVRADLYNKKTLRTKEVAKVLGISTRHVRRLTQKGKLRKEGRGVFSKEHIAEWKQNQCPPDEPN